MMTFKLRATPQRLGDITGIDKITGLLAVAKDGYPLPRRQQLAEDAHNTALATCALTLAIHVGKAQHRGVKAI